MTRAKDALTGKRADLMCPIRQPSMHDESSAVLPAGGRLSTPPERLTVYFPHCKPVDQEGWPEHLRAGRLRLWEHCEQTIGLQPDWDFSPALPGYFQFTLHTLRFLVPLVQEAALGRDASLDEAGQVLFDWDRQNPISIAPTYGEDAYRATHLVKAARRLGRKTPSPHAWGNEHSVGFRAAVIAYFRTIADQRGWLTKDRNSRVDRMAREHARYLMRRSSYRPDHNHGLYMDIGLLALGVSFEHCGKSRRWLKRAFQRIEQQMAANVSRDGVQLEQSGFYHFYTLCAFLETARVAHRMGNELSALFMERLDRMVEVAAHMASPDGSVRSLPFSPTDAVVTDLVRDLITEVPFPPGCQRWRDFFEQARRKRLLVCEDGGYSFFGRTGACGLQATFHTRVLHAPHMRQNAMEVTAETDSGPLIWMPSASSFPQRVAGKEGYFLSPTAHNTVAVLGKSQQPANPRHAHPKLFQLAKSYRINRLFATFGQEETLAWVRERFDLEQPGLNDRLDAANGAVVASATSPELEYVAARHETYDGVRHTRTVARIEGSLLVIRDILDANQEEHFVQSFHFAPDAAVTIEGERVRVEQKDSIRALALFDSSQAEARIVCGEAGDLVAGWYGADPVSVLPIPTLRVECTGRSASLLFVIGIQEEDISLSRQRIAGANDETESFILRLDRRNEHGQASRQMTLSFQNGTVDVQYER